MAKKITPSTAKKTSPAPKASTVKKTSAVRNSPIPKPVVARKKTVKSIVTPELIAERAYFISISSTGGSQDENWHRAERELRDGL